MHHLLLLVILFGWVLFLFISWEIALPLYLIAVAITLAIYWKIVQAMRNKPVVGRRAMVGAQGMVVRIDGTGAEVEYEGEIWRAVSPEPLLPGQQVIIKEVDGLILKVAPSKGS